MDKYRWRTDRHEPNTSIMTHGAVSPFITMNTTFFSSPQCFSLNTITIRWISSLESTDFEYTVNNVGLPTSYSKGLRPAVSGMLIVTQV